MRRIWTAVFVAVGMVVGVVTAAGPSGSVPAGGGTWSRPVPAGVGQGLPAWVTLVTGDRVLTQQVAGRTRVVQVVAGPGRSGVGFGRSVVNGREYVYPSDTLPALGRGRLDRRLFDVTSLVGQGYDDRRRGELPLLVTDRSGTLARRAPAGTEVGRTLPGVGMGAVSVDKARLGEFWRAIRPDLAGGCFRCGSTGRCASRWIRACRWSARTGRGARG